MCEQAPYIKNGLQESFFSAAHAHAHACPCTFTPRVPSFLAVSSGLLIESQQLMAAFTPQLPVIAAPVCAATSQVDTSLLVWESWPPASAGLPTVRAHRLFCRRESTNRWRATFPPVKCKCYKVQHHVGCVLERQILCTLHTCVYTYLHTCTHQVLYLHFSPFDRCAIKTLACLPLRTSGRAPNKTLERVSLLKY